MANDLSLMSQTTLSLEQRAERSKRALATLTKPSEAMEAAKRLVGSYAHLRPDQPETFLASIAAVLAQYPLGLVAECADPRVGIARKVEFLSIAKVVEWCDNRLAFHQALSSYQKREQAPAPRVFSEDERRLASEMLTKLAAELGAKLANPARKSWAEQAPSDDELRTRYATQALVDRIAEDAA